MAGVDTNVLVRYLVNDDPKQGAVAARLLNEAGAAGEPLVVGSTVALETEWVLRSRYRFDKAAVLRTFLALLGTREIGFEGEDAMEYALVLYADSSADFADCLHLARYTIDGAGPMLTFDAKAARLPGARLC